MRGLPVNAPARVISVGYWRQGHTRSQLLVGISDDASGLLQRILGQSTLRHLHPGKLPQNRRHFAHRHSHPVMHGVSGRLHPLPHSMATTPPSTPPPPPPLHANDPPAPITP